MRAFRPADRLLRGSRRPRDPIGDTEVSDLEEALVLTEQTKQHNRSLLLGLAFVGLQCRMGVRRQRDKGRFDVKHNVCMYVEMYGGFSCAVSSHSGYG